MTRSSTPRTRTACSTSATSRRSSSLLGRNPHASRGFIISWLRAAGEATRARDMEPVRAEPKATIGEAIRQAVPACNH
eukprot:11189767-Lingulodinium_polyedra.AAC.1